MNTKNAPAAHENLISSASGVSETPEAYGTSGRSPDLPDRTRLAVLPALLLIAAIICWMLLWFAGLAPLCKSSDLNGLTAGGKTFTYTDIFAEPVTADKPYEGQTLGTLKISNFESEVIVNSDNSGNAPVLLSSCPMPGESGRAVIDACGSTLVDRLAKSGSQTEIILETYYGTYTYAIEKVFTFREGSADAMIGSDRQELLIYSDYSELAETVSDKPMYRGVLCTYVSGDVVEWIGEVQ